MKKEPTLKKLIILRDDMNAKEWIIDAFKFEYKNKEYIVLVNLYQKNEKRPEYALLRLTFIKSADYKIHLIVPANVSGFIIDAKTIREFLDIAYSSDLGYSLTQLTEYFAKYIPTSVSLNKSEDLKEAMTYSLSKSDGENPNRKYCYALKRNPTLKKRSKFNDNKTKICRPELYELFKNDTSISFCYSIDKADEKTDEQIIKNFSRNI